MPASLPDLTQVCCSCCSLSLLTMSPSLAPLQVDLTSLRSIRTFASAWKALGTPLHVLVLNAGTFLTEFKRQASPAAHLLRAVVCIGQLLGLLRCWLCSDNEPPCFADVAGSVLGFRCPRLAHLAACMLALLGDPHTAVLCPPQERGRL